MAPALPQISEHYNISNVSLLNMTLTIFLLAYALGPLVLSPMSEIWGRKWVRIISYFYLEILLSPASYSSEGASHRELILHGLQPRVRFRTKYRCLHRV